MSEQKAPIAVSVKINGKDFVYRAKLVVTEWARGRLLQRKIDLAVQAISVAESDEAIIEAQKTIDESWSEFVKIAFGEEAVAELPITAVDLRDMLEAATNFTRAALGVPASPATAQ